jgi:hypothetical protein
VYPFIAQLKEDEIDKAYFQQDGAMAHTAHMSMALLGYVFVDRIISKTIWPPRSSDLSPPDFFLWGAMKNSVYLNNPHIIDDLKMDITENIRNVDRAILNTVFENTGESINVWRLAGNSLNITCNFLYCNHQVHRDFLIALYITARVNVRFPMLCIWSVDGNCVVNSWHPSAINGPVAKFNNFF